MDKAQGYLGLGRRAGLLLLGEERCAAAAEAGRARLLLLASDISPGGRKRAEAYLAGRRALLRTLPWPREELGALLGKKGAAMLCFTDLALAERFAAAMAEGAEDWQETAAVLAGRLDKARRRKAAPRKHDPANKGGMKHGS